MNIGIFGLGYVGLTTAACLLRRELRVVGYEISQIKRDELLGGRVPLREPEVGETVLKGIEDGYFSVSSEVDIENVPDVFFISVGTPSDERGGTSLKSVDSVFAHLNRMRDLLVDQGSEIILRSTVPPGTLRAFARKYRLLFESVPVAFYPEFLREGTAIRDFEQPPQTVIGTLRGYPVPCRIFVVLSHLDLEYVVVDSISAESLKFACNAFHALKVCFANEMGRLIASLGGDAHEVMELFVRDHYLNISERYLRPGAPFGGSCLPKDTRSIRNISASRGLQLFTIGSCEESNQAHYSFLIEKVMACRPKSIAILGLAFKRDTDDIRESPTVEILYRLASVGDFELRVHDFLVQKETVVGVNERLLDKLVTLPSILFSNDVTQTLEGVDTIIVMHDDARYERLIENEVQTVLNVARWSGLQSIERPSSVRSEVRSREFVAAVRS